jgi:electron transfer flavoprotein beta subunit
MSILFLVCLKPTGRTDVPLRLDDGGGRSRREDMLAGIDPADRSALQLALALRRAPLLGRDPHDVSRVAALTVGPLSAEAVLRDALAAGADEALRVWRRDWPEDLRSEGDGSAETTRLFARAAAEAAALRRPVLVLAGERSGDAGHECFGALLAGALRADFAHRVTEAGPLDEGWRVVVKLERGYGQVLHLSGPAVLTVAPRADRPAEPALPAWLASRRAAIPLVEGLEAMPRAARTTLRAPLPRVKRIALPGAGLDAAGRIQAMVAQESGRSGLVIPAGEGTPAQVEAVLRLLEERGYR